MLLHNLEKEVHQSEQHQQGAAEHGGGQQHHTEGVEEGGPLLLARAVGGGVVAEVLRRTALDIGHIRNGAAVVDVSDLFFLLYYFNMANVILQNKKTRNVFWSFCFCLDFYRSLRATSLETADKSGLLLSAR